MKDVTGAKMVEIRIDRPRGVIWVNTEEGCVLRICRIEGPIEIVSEHEDQNTEPEGN